MLLDSVLFEFFTILLIQSIHKLEGLVEYFPSSHPFSPVRLVSRLFYDCDQGQTDPVVAIARDQSSVYLQLLMHEAQPPSQFTVSTITR